MKELIVFLQFESSKLVGNFRCGLESVTSSKLLVAWGGTIAFCARVDVKAR